MNELEHLYIPQLQLLKPASFTRDETRCYASFDGTVCTGDFVAVLAELGVELSVIPGEKEAALSFAGASSAFGGESVIVLDVGGGSSEIIAGQAGGTPAYAHSFNIG